MTSTEAQSAHIPDEVREGDYGTRVAAVEPGGAEFIPLGERHGRPLNLFWTWTSPNFEFATVFVGVLPFFFGESFTEAALAIILGTALGSLAMAFLSARGPEHGVPQMILSRISFGRFGNILPAGINSLVAGVGWFAVNSVSGTLALSALTNWPEVPCLLLITVVQIAVAFFGHNLVHTFERLAFPLLAVVFTVVAVLLLAKSHPSALSGGAGELEQHAGQEHAEATRPAGTRTRRTTPATSRRTRTSGPSACGRASACSCPACCSSSPAPPPRR
jgi:NCS1 family nucleobase:cation symporter-1